MDCREFDEQVVRLDEIAEAARQFVLVRLIRIEGVDLSQFDFDFDMTWAAFFVNADGRVYGRYGSRDASGAEGRNNLAGLNHALQQALAAHRRAADDPPADGERQPPRIIDRAQGCIHCHQVTEVRRAAARRAGQWDRRDVWVYPLPENVGLVLEPEREDRVRAVLPDTPAARAGVAAGDVLESIGGRSVASTADVQYALHRGPWQGELPIAWRRGDERRTATLRLDDGWKKTNITWRPSALELLPAVGLWGKDLSPEEKQTLGLAAERLAFRQQARVHSHAAAAGIQGGDVIVGANGRKFEMTMADFLGYVRQNYFIGDEITLDLLRDGRPVEVRMTLK